MKNVFFNSIPLILRTRSYLHTPVTQAFSPDMAAIHVVDHAAESSKLHELLGKTASASN